jgi:hypothetical protein
MSGVARLRNDEIAQASAGHSRRVAATGPAVARGSGDAVPPTDPAAFVGQIAPAVSTMSCSGQEFGFEFDSNRGASTAPLSWAQIGTEQNGSFI